MAKFNILPNTPFFFVRKEDYLLKMQTERTRFFEDYEYQDRQFDEPYIFSFDQTDPLFFQYRTDYSEFTITLYSSTGTIIGTLTKTLLLNYASTSEFYGSRLYQSNIDLSSLSGEYYVEIYCYEINKPILTFKSALFHVEQNCPGLKLEWFGSTSLPDPFIWDVQKATLRMVGEIKRKLSCNEKITYVTTEGNIENTYCLPKNMRLLQVDIVPEYIETILDLSVQHDSFYVNEVEFGASESGWEFESTHNCLYPMNIKLTQKNYYNFAEDEELTGNNPVYDDDYMMINDTDYVLINTTDKVTINN
jgi:hypothetical protein